MTPIKLDGDDDDEDEDDEGNDDDDGDDDDSTPVPRSKRRTGKCVLLARFSWLQNNLPPISEPVRRDMKSRRRQQEEENDVDDDDDDEASEPADSILGSESEGEESTEVDGLLDE